MKEALDVLTTDETEQPDLSFDADVTDSLTLFMNQLGRYPLLTAAEEVELAKKIERGDHSAKQAMVEANLRLVVSIVRERELETRRTRNVAGSRSR